MIQNRLATLLEGVADTLVERVAPEIDDAYARAQALAAADIVANLSTRVAWDRVYLLWWVREAHRLARRAPQPLPEDVRRALAASLDPLAAAADVDAYADLQRLGLVALRRHVAGGPDARLACEVAALVDSCLDDELSRTVPPRG